MECGKLIKDEVQWILPEQRVVEAAELMAAFHLSWVPVCGNDFKPVGIITTQDIVGRVVAPGRSAEQTPVEDVMSTPVHAVEPVCSVEVAAEMMRRLRVSRLVVLDAAGRLEGVVGLADLLQHVLRDRDESAAPRLGRLHPQGTEEAAPSGEGELGAGSEEAAPEQGDAFDDATAGEIGAWRPLDDDEPVAPARPRPVTSRKSGPAVWWVLGLALLVRVLIFPWSENKYADAPMRALLAEYRASSPGVAHDPRNFHQFGPLPIEVVRASLALGGDARLFSRVPSLVAGLALFLPFIALTRRLTRDRRVVVASALALALSPLAIQLSTTAASEPIYLLFWLACLERLHAAFSPRAGGDEDELPRWLTRRRRDLLLAGVWASLAAVSRYDAWLVIPVATVAAAVFLRRDRGALADLPLFVLVAAVLPVAYLVWVRAAGADPWLFGRTILREHAETAGLLSARIGPWAARLDQVWIWVLGLTAAMTPIGLLGLPFAASRWRRLSAATRVIVVAALAPVVVYLAKGLLFDAFAPQPRFALVPGVLLLPLALDALAARMRGRLLGVAVAAGAVAFAVAVSLMAFGRRGGIRSGAEALAPLTRLEPDARAVATYLALHRRPGESVFVDTYGYVDIMIAHAARVPLREVATLWRTRALSDSLAEERSRSQADLFAAHDSSWGAYPLHDWPRSGVRFGHWRVARID